MSQRRAPAVLGMLLSLGLVTATTTRARAAPPEARARIDKFITQQPEMGRVRAGPLVFVLRGSLPPKTAQHAIRVATRVVADVQRRLSLTFADRGQPEPRVVDVCLFDRPEPYAALGKALFVDHSAPSPLGYYIHRWQLVVASVQHGMGNLRHELVHPVVAHDFPGIPSWLNEGLGSLYGSARLTAKGDFRFLVNYRLRDLHRALRTQTLPSLEAVVRKPPGEFYGQAAMTHYALSRYLLLYLDRQGQLGTLYQQLRDPKRSADALATTAELIGDYDQFLKWARDLRYPVQRKAPSTR